MNFDVSTTSFMEYVGEVSDKAPNSAEKAVGNIQDLWLIFLGRDWSIPSWDSVILLFFIISVVMYGFVLGRDRVVAILISTYISLAVTTNLPYMEQISDAINKGNSSFFQISSFLVVFVLIFILLTRGSIIRRLSSLAGSWWQIIIFAVLQVGLFTSIIMSFLPIETHEVFSEVTVELFISERGRFAWMILPVIALAVFKAKKKPEDV